MLTDDTYAGRLHRSGYWDAALALTTDVDLRAQILVDRFWWRREGADDAEQAIALLTDDRRAQYVSGQLAYGRLLFGSAKPDDEQTAEKGFQAEGGGWGAFWLGVYADHIMADRILAKARYDEALALADGDLLLESYAVRHLGDHAMERNRTDGEQLLRRSLHLRSALGARPQVAAAQATLAEVLADGPERDTLREAALATAVELGIPWLRPS